jgi:UDP:flavonoid glycosyltransferase YjiC (YdhE family)
MRLLIPLFSPATGTWGGLTRAVAVAAAARHAGHKVAFCASGYLETTLREHGYEVYSTPPTTMFGLPGPLSRVVERRSHRMTPPFRPGASMGSIWFLLRASGMGGARYLRRLVETEIEAAKDFRADKLFTDLDPGAFLTSVVTGLPLAMTYAHVLMHGSGTYLWHTVKRAIGRVLRSYAKPPLTPDELFFDESILKIIPSIPELDDADPDRTDVCYVGQLLGPIHSSPTQFHLEEQRRYVFVYPGVGSISLDTVEDVLPQVFLKEDDPSCVVGAQGIESPYQLGTVLFRPYVPADDLLPQCDWTICHGGQNTITQSLYYGVPLLIFPGPIYERRYNAQKVEQAGAGRMGEVDQFTVEWFRASLEHQSECAAKAVMLSERIRTYGGATAAVAAIGKWG